MDRKEYMEEIKKDVRKYINEEIVLSDFESIEELEEKLNDVLWADDGVTGNGSGIYTFNAYDAERNISHAWDVLHEALLEFGCDDVNILEKGAEWCDVAIRCYLLNNAINEVLGEMKANKKA